SGSGYLDLLATWDAQNRAEAESDPDKASVYTGLSGLTGTSLALKLKPAMRPPYLIKLEQAVELGLINSREYQDARENLYLTSLPVTFQRFAFAPQLFAVAQGVREYAGSKTTDGPRNDWAVNSNVGVAKLFSTGALLLFNFANQTVVHLSGALRG